MTLPVREGADIEHGLGGVLGILRHARGAQRLDDVTDRDRVGLRSLLQRVDAATTRIESTGLEAGGCLRPTQHDVRDGASFDLHSFFPSRQYDRQRPARAPLPPPPDRDEGRGTCGTLARKGWTRSGETPYLLTIGASLIIKEPRCR